MERPVRVQSGVLTRPRPTRRAAPWPILTAPPGRLVPANRWQVFEERTFRSRRSDLPEPREAVVADLTGHGKNDLAVVVHDRILLYPQE